MTTSTDNRNISTTYSYDVINRVTDKTYSDGTPSSFFLYDTPRWTYVSETSPADPPSAPTTQANVVGRLSVEGTHSPNGAALSAAAYSYDHMGRVAIASTCTPRVCANNGFTGNIADQYDIRYVYDLAGNLTFAGRGFLSRKDQASPNAGYYYGGLTYTVTKAGQVSQATSDVAVDAGHPHQDIASAVAYSPLGGVTQVALGQELTQITTYSPRGWMTGVTSKDANGNGTLLDTSVYDAVGNLLHSKDSNLGSFSSCYDHLNRLTTFVSGNVTCPNSTAYGVAYGYDAFGNLLSRAAQGGSSTYQFSSTAFPNNQDPLRQYDAAGHVSADGVHSYVYDAEGRISTVDNGTRYYYDAEGMRFAEGPVGQTPMTDFLYDLDGHLVTTVGSDYKLIRTNLYVAGHHWADYTAGTGTGGGRTEYRLSDQVGTFVYKFDQSGNPLEQCTSRPFGEDLSCSQSVDFSETHFADTKRDQESNLDYMSARYYSSTLGRFMSPDWSSSPEAVPYADLENPQSLNLYSYVKNNPLSQVDQDGHCAEDACVIEGGVTAGVLIYGAAVGTAAYFNTPSGQRSLDTFTSAAGSAVYSAFHGITGLFNSSTNSSPAQAATTQPGQKNADFVVTPAGTAVATDPGRVRDSLVNAPGVATNPVTGPSGETGTKQTGVQTPNGPVDVRTMDGSSTHGPRTVITHPGTNSPKTPDGKATNNKNENHIPNDHTRPQPQ